MNNDIVHADPYTTLADETYFMQMEQQAQFELEDKIEFEATVIKVMEYANVDRENATRIVKEMNNVQA